VFMIHGLQELFIVRTAIVSEGNEKLEPHLFKQGNEYYIHSIMNKDMICRRFRQEISLWCEYDRVLNDG
jgi:hypothetical protein